MKFLVEYIACCGSRPVVALEPDEEKRLMPLPPLAPLQEAVRGIVGRRYGRLRYRRRKWRPTLTSISEDRSVIERNNSGDGRKTLPPCLRRRDSATAHADWSRSSNHDGFRRAQHSTMMHVFSPAPFMF